MNTLARMTTTEIVSAIHFSAPFTTRGPMIFLLHTNFTRGMSAKGSSKLSTTELNTMRASDPLSPAMMVTNRLGTMATDLVMKALRAGLILKSTNPSMTYCPASVPVIVLESPEASRAQPKKVLAAVPRTFLSICGAFCKGWSMSFCFSSGDTPSTVECATSTTATLMNRENPRAKADSRPLYSTTSLDCRTVGGRPELPLTIVPRFVPSGALSWYEEESTSEVFSLWNSSPGPPSWLGSVALSLARTIAECRKRLWGITKAPSMETAM
mmetsp:Transcript_7205/g.26126  ORF Transcript_7205/g.26126 Transcript_7205/m.26126 type:complete len:269 (-) Transcript_7205:838-1644(-)